MNSIKYCSDGLRINHFVSRKVAKVQMKDIYFAQKR